jgi:ribonucleoside-diphosphate reductase alpha chain
MVFEMKINPSPEIYNQQSAALMRQRGILRASETIEDALERVLTAMLQMDKKLNQNQVDSAFQDKLVALVNTGSIIFGTPILTGAGRTSQVTAACTVLPIQVTHGQADYDHFGAKSYSSLGQSLGTGYDLSELLDPVSTLMAFNAILNKMNGEFVSSAKRPVASMATLRADHPQILAFIRAKRNADFFEWRFNISVFLTDAFMHAAEQNAPWFLRDNKGKVVDQIPAKTLIEAIADSAHYCGEPGVLFKDRVEEDNPTPQWHYQSTAPCAEIAMAAGDACQFSYVNLSNFVHAGVFDTARFAEAVEVLTRFLDNSVEYTIENEANAGLDLPLVREKRRIGVAVTGFADLLIKLEIAYEDPKAVNLAEQISELLDFHSKKASVGLAKLRGVFPSYEQSRYKEHEWVRRKASKTTGVVSKEAWDALYDEMESTGIRHATTTAMPPTGTSSTIANISKSLEPHFSYQDFMNGGVLPIIKRVIETHIAPEMQGEILAHVEKQGCFPEAVCEEKPFLKTACQIEPTPHLAIQAGFQTFLDDAISKTINMAQKTTVKAIEGIIYEAYKSHLKGITIFRDNCLSERELEQTSLPKANRFFVDLNASTTRGAAAEADGQTNDLNA